MKSVPLFIVEEHLEAFFVWHYARVHGFLPPKHNTLLHVDEHSDLDRPSFMRSIHEVTSDLNQILDFTYSELGISDFILPAVYQQLFNHVIWLRRKHYGHQPRQEQFVIYSYRDQGRYFFLAEPDRMDTNHKRRTLASTRLMTVGDECVCDGAVVLDIDLDYFSCATSRMRNARVEITRAEYESYLANRYHYLRVSGQPNVKVVEENCKYYVYLNYAPDFTCKQATASEEVILKRISDFVAFLERNLIQPAVIDICRSRFSGYTPESQWSFIESNLLDGLRRHYQLDIMHLHEVLPTENDNAKNCAARGKPASVSATRLDDI